jgi:hypothetical protein
MLKLNDDPLKNKDGWINIMDMTDPMDRPNMVWKIDTAFMGLELYYDFDREKYELYLVETPKGETNELVFSGYDFSFDQLLHFTKT